MSKTPRVPEMPPFYYFMNFKNGMAYTQDFRKIKEIVTAECDVSIGKTEFQHEFMHTIDTYISQHYVPGDLEVLPVLDFSRDIWWRDSRHRPAPERSSRQFLAFSLLSARVGYFTDVDKMLAVLFEGPPYTVIFEVSDYDAAVSMAQMIFAKHVLCFSGYFDRNAEPPPVLCELPTDSLITLPYWEWMQKHCVLPPELQEYSVYGCVNPITAADLYRSSV